MSSARKILDEIKKASGAIRSVRHTGAKAPLIKAALLKVFEGLEPETPLPPIRAVAKAAGASLVPVHKAMTELKSEGVVIPKSTSGFVKGRPAGKSLTYAEGGSPFDPGVTPLKFATDSAEPQHKKLWTDLFNSERFKAQNPFAKAEMLFLSAGWFASGEAAGMGADIIETNPIYYHRNNLRDSLLDIRAYVSSEGNDTGIFDGRLMPFYQHTNYIFFNRGWLKQKKFPEPAFRDFRGQREYFSLLRKSKGADFRIGSCLQPAMLPGGSFYDLMNVLGGEEPAPEDEERLENVFRELLEFCSLFDYRGYGLPSDKTAASLFESGETPFLAGYSGNYWSFRFGSLPFEWGAYPLFSIDGSCLKFPVSAGILKRTMDPVNAFQILLFLRDDKTQEIIRTETGCIPVKDSLFKMDCLSAAQNDFFRGVYEKSPVFTFADYQQFYVHNLILTPRLLDAAVNKRAESCDLKSVFHLVRTYLAASSGRSAQQ
jgi:hypothetical protein